MGSITNEEIENNVMNICLLTSTYLPLIGGLEMVVHNLATALTNIGHNVFVVTPIHRNHHFDGNHNYRIIRFGFRGYGRLGLVSASAILTLAYVIRRYRIDVINAHNVYTPGSWAYYFRRFYKKIPIVGTPHGDDIQTFPELKWGVRLNPEVDRIVRRNVKSFAMVSAISGSIKKELKEILVDDRKIREVPNGVWTSNFQKKIDKIEIRKKYGIPLNSVGIISVGRNAIIKGFEFGLDAVAKLLNSEYKISYILVGRDMSAIKEKARILGISGSIITPGELENDKVATLLQASDIYVSTSFMESFGLTTLEALSAGLPCIVTNIAVNKDLISDEIGRLVEPGNSDQLANAVKKIIEDESLRTNMGIKARIEAQKYDWPNIARMYVNVYREALTD